MPQPFTLAQSRCTEISDPALRAAIHSHTGDDAATASVLRSIARFAEDTTIARFEVTPRSHRPYRSGAGIAWSVRAIRT